MLRRVLKSVVFLSLALLALAAHGTEMAAKPELKSAGQLAFGPGGVLFVADSAGTAVHAFDLKDADEPGDELESIDEIDEQVASLLGTTARDVLIQDIAVHPTSRNVYLSVSRGRGEDASPAVVMVDGEGQLSLVDLKGASVTSTTITNAPAEDAKTRRGRPMRALTITDIAFHDGHLYVAGLSNEEFASNLRKIAYPFTGEMGSTSVEIYHGAHGKFETHAPIRTLMPYESGGQAHLLAAYTCTPLVTFPLDKLENGAHVKGTTIAELGFGNAPLDMIQFDKEGEPYVLILNSSRGGMRIKASDINEAEPISTEADVTRDEPMLGVPYLTVPMGGIVRADSYNDEKLIVLRRDLSTGSLQLRLWSTAWI